MEDSIGALVPIVFIALLLGGWIVGRVLKHRERMEMLRMGIIPPNDLKRWQKYGGPGWAQGMQGMQMPPGMQPPPTYQPYDEQMAAQYTLQRGIRTTMVGLAITIGFSFIGYDSSSFPPIHPGPWLLGGLIPMFFGVAQIINALLAGATIGARMPQPPPPYDAPKPPPPPPPQPGHPFGGFSEPGRPGSRYEELARPVPPPDRTN